jgi:hypothetical protein
VLAGSLAQSGLTRAYPGGNVPSMSQDVAVAQKAIARNSPIAEVAFKLLALSNLKAQAHGRLSRKAHEWINPVLSVDLATGGRQFLLDVHLPLALAAGIELDAIEAVQAGNDDELSGEDRQQVDFIRAVWQGTVTDELWIKQVALIGSERGVVDQLCMIMQIFCRVRIAQALGAPGSSQEDVESLIASYRGGDVPLPDIGAYEDFYRQQPLPIA